MAWTVKFYKTPRGESPVQDFITDQEETIYSRILQSILLLKSDGPFLKPPYAKKLQRQLYELRISGSLAIRILYTLHNSEYYLLHAFKKKTQKTPTKELKIAIDRMKKLI